MVNLRFMRLAFENQIQLTFRMKAKVVREMNVMLIIVFLIASAFSTSEATTCEDENLDCDPANCADLWNLKYCADTCKDCDGMKLKSLKSRLASDDCIDALNTDECKDFIENTSDGEYGCANPESELSKNCKKSCNRC